MNTPRGQIVNKSALLREVETDNRPDGLSILHSSFCLLLHGTGSSSKIFRLAVSLFFPRLRP
jgi:hypothetical protein